MMRKAWIVARWEFLTTVKRRSYIFMVVAMPLFYAALVAVAALAGRSASQTASRIPIGVVDRAHVLDFKLAAEMATPRDERTQAFSNALDRGDAATAVASALLPTVALAPFDDLDTALQALREEKVGSVYVIEPDYVDTGSMTSYARDGGLLPQANPQRRATQVADALRASLLRPKLSDHELDRAYAPAAELKRMRLTKDGRIEDMGDAFSAGPIAGSFGVILLMTLAIFFSAGFLQQATLADRVNRMIEILTSSVDPQDLLIGKILGLGGAGLLQIGIYLALIVVPGATLLSVLQIPLDKLALSLVYFAVGYLLFASLIAGAGMLGRTAQEGAQLSTLWTFTAASPWFFIANLAVSPNGWLARTLSFFPLTSPITMMLRLGSGDVPAIDIAISLLVDTAAIYVALRGASRIFRAATLMHGKRATLPEFIRWMRAG